MGEEGKQSIRQLWATDKEARDDFQASALSGAATAFLVVGILLSYPSTRVAFDRRRPLPAAANVIFAVFVIGGLVAWAWRSRSWLIGGLAGAAVPLMAAGWAIRTYDPDPSWASPVRAIGLGSMIAVMFAHAFVHGRRKRELERAVFTDATVASFFVTVIAAAVIGVMDTALDLPPISLLWVPLVANVTWFAALILVGRRYS